MKVPAPHYLLYSHARHDCQLGDSGQWRFVLESADGSARLEATDEEHASGQRLELLATVRGLEALDQPSRVTLVTGSRYVSRGIRFGLAQWREDSWQWERYGEMIPIKDGDLWRRVDQAMQFHIVECRLPRLDDSDDLGAPPLRLAPPPASEEPTEAEDDIPVVCSRRHRGKLLRFDQSQLPQPTKRARQAGSWLGRLWQWWSLLFGGAP
jgi:ribonuclease HI